MTPEFKSHVLGNIYAVTQVALKLPETIIEIFSSSVLNVYLDIQLTDTAL